MRTLQHVNLGKERSRWPTAGRRTDTGVSADAVRYQDLGLILIAFDPMDLALFDSMAAFIEARLDETGRDRAGYYIDGTYAQRDIEAKVHIMNRAFDARVFAASFPDDPGAQAMLAAYDTVLRHLAQTYDTHLDYQQAWCPEAEEWPA